MQILCGDIGGTNTRLMVAEVDGMHISTILQKQYSSHVFGCFEDVLDIFLREVEVVPESACFAVAAPVKGSEAQMTNLSWNLNVSTLESIYNLLIQAEDTKLKLEGHTDNAGSTEANYNLSQNRAQAVVNFLRGKGIPQSRFQTVIGKGEDEPLANNSSAKGRAKNRRVVITLLK